MAGDLGWRDGWVEASVVLVGVLAIGSYSDRMIQGSIFGSLTFGHSHVHVVY